MSSWTDSFLQQALASVPDPVYRRRVEVELADHLDAMAADLMEAGYSPREARAAALSPVLLRCLLYTSDAADEL